MSDKTNYYSESDYVLTGLVCQNSEEKDTNADLCDCSGYIPLSQEVNLNAVRSENYKEYSRGYRDAYMDYLKNNTKIEDDPSFIESVRLSRGDVSDLNDFYNNGYMSFLYGYGLLQSDDKEEIGAGSVSNASDDTNADNTDG